MKIGDPDLRQWHDQTDLSPGGHVFTCKDHLLG
jgi:hypothetical protein